VTKLCSKKKSKIQKKKINLVRFLAFFFRLGGDKKTNFHIVILFKLKQKLGENKESKTKHAFFVFCISVGAVVYHDSRCISKKKKQLMTGNP
jgi:hypothetical protein